MGRGNGTYNPYTPDSGARPPALTGRERELAHMRSIATLVGRASRRAMLQMSAHKRAGQRLRQALRVLKAFEVTLPGDVSFRLDVDAAVGQADSSGHSRTPRAIRTSFKSTAGAHGHKAESRASPPRTPRRRSVLSMTTSTKTSSRAVSDV